MARGIDLVGVAALEREMIHAWTSTVMRRPREIRDPHFDMMSARHPASLLGKPLELWETRPRSSACSAACNS